MKSTIKSLVVLAALAVSAMANAAAPSQAPVDKVKFYNAVEDAAKENGYREQYRNNKSVVWVDDLQYLHVLKASSVLVVVFNVGLDGEPISHLSQQAMVTYSCENKTINTFDYAGWRVVDGKLLHEKLRDYANYGDLGFPKGSVTALLKTKCPK